MKKPIIHPFKINFDIPVSDTINLKRFVFIYIIEGKKLHLVDTGVAPAFTEIKEFIKSIGSDISEIQNIFLTHSHPDHIGTAKLIQQACNCNVYALKDEISWIENTDLQFQQRPVPGFQKLVAGPVKVCHPIEDFKEIQPEENITIQSYSTPGHSAGSASYYLKEKNALFCGDAVLLPGEIPIFEDVNQYLNSLETIKRINPDILFSAWDKPRNSKEIPVILEKSRNYVLIIRETAKKVATKFENPKSMEFCAAVLKNLNQNEQLANPLLLKSILACL